MNEKLNIEKTLRFMLEEQSRYKARSDARHDRLEADFARSSRRLDRIERVLTQTNRVVGTLASMGVGLRSDIRRHEKAIARHEEMMAEMDGKLNAVIAVLDDAGERIKAQTAAGLETDRKIEALVAAGLETDRKIEALTASQGETGTKLQALIASQGETGTKLQALVEVVDKMARRNGH